jgi:hypothetical protein
MRKCTAVLRPSILGVLIFITHLSFAQDSTVTVKKKKSEEREYMNVVRYNLSGPIMFGPGYAVFGYERVINEHHSFSINMGKTALPKLKTIVLDSFQTSHDFKNTGLNISMDYRFYLEKENRYSAPHGLYIGPYYSFNTFSRNNDWTAVVEGSDKYAKTESSLNIHTIGFELGYQFILWKRLTLDLVMVGPGLAKYDLKSTIEGNIDPANKEQILEAINKVFTQKFPGMDIAIGDNTLTGSGTVGSWSIGYRYLFQIGFRF